METFVKSIENLVKSGDDRMNLHIEEIGGLNTFVSIVFEEGKLYLAVLLTDFHRELIVDLEAEIVEEKIQAPEEFVLAIREKLKNVKLDKFSGTLYVESFFPFQERGDVSYLADIFEMDHIKFDFEKCAVCYNATQTKTTRCKHPLCLLCWTNISRTTNNCPLCRNVL